jgi:hypothetical protein
MYQRAHSRSYFFTQASARQNSFILGWRLPVKTGQNHVGQNRTKSLCVDTQP